MDLAEDFFFLINIAVVLFFKLSQKYSNSPFQSKSDYQRNWQ